MSVLSAFLAGAEALAGVEDLAGDLEAVLPKLKTIVIGWIPSHFDSWGSTLPYYLSDIGGDNSNKDDEEKGSEHVGWGADLARTANLL